MLTIMSLEICAQVVLHCLLISCSLHDKHTEHEGPNKTYYRSLSAPQSAEVKMNGITHMWQSRVEIEHYSIAYFDRIAVFEAL